MIVKKREYVNLFCKIYKIFVTVRYCLLVNKSSEKRAPKCLHFSILCANGLLFTPSLHKIVSELVGVNSNNSSVFGFLLVGENGVLERV